MFKKIYAEQEFKNLLRNNSSRRGWDFSKMKTKRLPVPWNYLDLLALYIKPEDSVLDIGTGGGETFLQVSQLFKYGIGIDIDPEMIQVAKENRKEINNISFYQDTEHLENTKEQFDVILNRHASFDLNVVFNHLKQSGYFMTQQVGEKNMLNIKQVLNKVTIVPTITSKQVEKSGFKVLAFMEYNVEYIVEDVESLVFWLQALDMLHADLPGNKALSNINLFNKILQGNVDERGFITNEQRYLVIAQK